MLDQCSPLEIALKSYFLGPQAENAQFLQLAVLKILRQYTDWRKKLFPHDGVAISDRDHLSSTFLAKQRHMHKLLQMLSERFQNEIPQYSPRYLGHMYSELSLPGLLGHFVALLHNPNNISKESSNIGLKIEAEAIRDLYQIFKWKNSRGHFTSGGTVANLEALLRMRARLPEKSWHKAKLISSAAAHYSWKKNLKIIGLPESAFIEVPLDSKGRMSIPHLEKILKELKSPLLGVVSLFGSTELGTIDDIDKINQALANSKRERVWHHVDAAYGGFFATIKQSPYSYLSKQSRALRDVDSLTLDPHKLGYIPFGCGAFLCRKPEDYDYAKVDAPYIQFKSNRDVGVQSVEGSRPATGATATWLSARTIGYDAKGLGRVLERHLRVKSIFQSKILSQLPDTFFPEGLDLNIICWSEKTQSRKLSDSNALVDHIYRRASKLPSPYFVSKTTLSLEKNPCLKSELKKRNFITDTDQCTLVRMTLMNPFLITKESKTSYLNEFVTSIQNLMQEFDASGGKLTGDRKTKAKSVASDPTEKFATRYGYDLAHTKK